MKIAIIAIIIVSTLFVVVSMFKCGSFIKNLTKAVFQGIASLFAVNTIGLITGVTIALNWYTVFTVCIFGTPGCIILLLLNTLFR